MAKKSRSSLRKDAVELFWQAIPPIWYIIRSHLDKNAREDFEITGGHFHVLRRINCGATTISDLADAGHISRPVVSRKVDSLVDRGLVTRKELAEDRRFTILALTEEGEQILTELKLRNWELLEEKLDLLDDREVKVVREAFTILKKISD